MSKTVAMQEEIPITSQPPALNAPTLKVDFTWKKWKINISQTSPDGTQCTPYMLVDCNMRKPHLEFKSLTENNAVIGTGNIHAVSIHPDYVLRGEKGQIRALKKWSTRYTHSSGNYGTEGRPMEMTWTTSSNFVDWDFICLDENQEPVARFNSSWWAVRKLGNIEFLGPKANDPAAREEIVVVGLTLWYCMVFRMNNIFNFFGAIFAKTGPIKQDGGEVKKDSPPSEMQMDDFGKGKVA